jgi:hypothetical protein
MGLSLVCHPRIDHAAASLGYLDRGEIMFKGRRKTAMPPPQPALAQLMAKPARNGAPDKVRTRDPLITNQVLYQLSYKGSGGLISQARKKKSQKTGFGDERPRAFRDLQHFARHA